MKKTTGGTLFKKSNQLFKRVINVKNPFFSTVDSGILSIAVILPIKLSIFRVDSPFGSHSSKRKSKISSKKNLLKDLLIVG
jgi:hypothetical protein